MIGRKEPRLDQPWNEPDLMSSIPTSQRQDKASTASQPPSRAGRRLVISIAVAMAALAAGVVVYRGMERRALAAPVRNLFEASRYDEARKPLERLSRLDPSSGEAAYLEGWLALADDRPLDVVKAVDRARALGYDGTRLDCLAAIYQARAKRYSIAEPILEAAYQAHMPPEALVAKELASIYLSTYRLGPAGAVIERWRTLVPGDPLPYMWKNQIGARTEAEHSLMIQNYRAALELDPNLDEARIGLANELSKDRRFEEAEQEYQTYLEHKPGDPEALIGLGRNAFQQGNLEAALRNYEQALQANPRQPEALKELSQADTRMGRFESARDRYRVLVELDPFDYELRYSYAQTLRRLGDEAGYRKENATASRLRKENDEITQLRFDIMKHPDDIEIRYGVAKWMLEHGHIAEGLKWTSEVLRVKPNHAPTHKILADHYANTGDAGLANYHRLLAGSTP